MLIVCPNCKLRFALDPGGAEAGQKVRCSNCRAVFRLVPKGEGRKPRLKVVIANESVPFCESVRQVLAGEPFEIFVCNDGLSALETVERVRPELLLLDVALPVMLGFEVCDRVRQNAELSGVKIVLIASVYDKTRYKRSPVSLYGADDYIEKHHIPDSLAPMIYRLVGSQPQLKRFSPDELAAQVETRCRLRGFEVSETCCAQPPAETSPGAASLDAASPAAAGALDAAPREAGAGERESAELGEAHAKARRLARIIVSDIALYNQQKVEQGVRDGNFYRLLAEDIREGELLYSQRVPPQLLADSSFLAEAFEQLITKKRAELRG